MDVKLAEIRSNLLELIEDSKDRPMAKIKSPIELHWRSKHGGAVGQAGFGGSVQRAHSERTKRPSQHCFNWFSAQSEAMNLWRALDPATLALWETFASDNPQTDKYGNPIIWSGFNWFWKFNRASLKLFGNGITLPPDSPTCEFLPVLTLDFAPPPYTVFIWSVPPPIGDQAITVSEAINLPDTAQEPPSKLQFYDTLFEDEASGWPVTAPGAIQTGGLRHWFQLATWDQYGRSAIYSPLWLTT